MKVAFISAPSAGSRNTRFDSLLNAIDRLSKFIDPIVPQMPSAMIVFEWIMVGWYS